MFVLGIGKDVDSSELIQIASGPNNVFTVDTFSDLENKADEAKRGICVLGIACLGNLLCTTPGPLEPPVLPSNFAQRTLV